MINITLSWKWLTVADTPAYYGTELITSVKSFMILASWPIVWTSKGNQWKWQSRVHNCKTFYSSNWWFSIQASVGVNPKGAPCGSTLYTLGLAPNIDLKYCTRTAVPSRVKLTSLQLCSINQHPKGFYGRVFNLKRLKISQNVWQYVAFPS